jgi:pyruvyl transferase EpsO
MSRVISNSASLARLRFQLDRTLAEQLGGAERVAMLDFPHHDNVGDSAIWWGEILSLRRLGITVLHASDLPHYHADIVERLPCDVPLLLHGGGNLGDLWPQYQEFREHIATAFPSRRFIQLPQSIHFTSLAREEQAARVMGAHANFTVLTRDRVSHAIARERMGLNAVLCPDAAFGIEPEHVTPRKRPAAAVFRLWRTDKEAWGARDTTSQAMGSSDWLDEGCDWRSRVDLAIARRLNARVASSTLALRAAVVLYNHAAVSEVRRGGRILDQGELIITDRLHAVILSLLSGHRVVWSDNTYGKIERVLSTWLPDPLDCVQMPDRAAAVEFAQRTLAHAT